MAGKRVLLIGRAFAELDRVGATAQIERSRSLLSLDKPVIDFTAMGKAMGASAVRAEDRCPRSAACKPVALFILSAHDETEGPILSPGGLSDSIGIVPGRTCGTCTACCKIPKIDAPSLQKPAGVMCQHCTGSNCGIYESRPEQCRTFFCLWRRVAGMPDEMRPDRIGVMFSIESVLPPQNPFERLFVIGRSINSLADLDSAGARQVIQVFVDRGDLPVWLSHQQNRRLLHPHPALRDAILSPAPPPPELAADVQVWRSRLGL